MIVEGAGITHAGTIITNNPTPGTCIPGRNKGAHPGVPAVTRNPAAATANSGSTEFTKSVIIKAKQTKFVLPLTNGSGMQIKESKINVF